MATPNGSNQSVFVMLALIKKKVFLFFCVSKEEIET
jgi:hypothetical protein